MDATFTLSDRLEYAWRIYLLNHELLRNAERKLEFLIALTTAVAIFALWSVYALVTANGTRAWGLATIWDWVLLVSLAGYVVVLCLFGWRAVHGGLFAATDTVTRNRKVARLIFFKHINERPTHEEYYEHFMACNSDEALRDIIFQIRELAYLIDCKYKHYKKAWFWLQFQLGLTLFAFGLYVLR